MLPRAAKIIATSATGVKLSGISDKMNKRDTKLATIYGCRPACFLAGKPKAAKIAATAPITAPGPASGWAKDSKNKAIATLA